MDAKRFGEVTGGQATEINRAEGGAFSLFGSRIQGRHVELVPNARIVQAWQSGGWEPGTFHRAVRAGSAGDRHQAHVRPHGLSLRPRGASPDGLEDELLGPAG